MLIQVSGSAGRCQSKWVAVNKEITCHSQGDWCSLSGSIWEDVQAERKGEEAGEFVNVSLSWEAEREASSNSNHKTIAKQK